MSRKLLNSSIAQPAIKSIVEYQEATWFIVYRALTAAVSSILRYATLTELPISNQFVKSVRVNSFEAGSVTLAVKTPSTDAWSNTTVLFPAAWSMWNDPVHELLALIVSRLLITYHKKRINNIIMVQNKFIGTFVVQENEKTYSSPVERENARSECDYFIIDGSKEGNCTAPV